MSFINSRKEFAIALFGQMANECLHFRTARLISFKVMAVSYFLCVTVSYHGTVTISSNRTSMYFSIIN